ncbi:MAG: hypothetical protein FJZ01_14350 [Candidatus Sericytochromatia bacterium]|nr:hypothetical protein [Candidatus Tanganyikabacteria bacterium]
MAFELPKCAGHAPRAVRPKCMVRPPAPARPPSPPRKDEVVKSVEMRWVDRARRATTPLAAMEIFDQAHEAGFKKAADAAIRRAADLCQTQKDALQVAKTASLLGYEEAAEYAYKRVGELEHSSEIFDN